MSCCAECASWATRHPPRTACPFESQRAPPPDAPRLCAPPGAKRGKSGGAPGVSTQAPPARITVENPNRGDGFSTPRTTARTACDSRPDVAARHRVRQNARAMTVVAIVFWVSAGLLALHASRLPRAARGAGAAARAQAGSGATAAADRARRVGDRGRVRRAGGDRRPGLEPAGARLPGGAARGARLVRRLARRDRRACPRGGRRRRARASARGKDPRPGRGGRDAPAEKSSRSATPTCAGSRAR